MDENKNTLTPAQQTPAEPQKPNNESTSTGNPSPETKPIISPEIQAIIDAQVEAARRQEKNKLYVTIDELRKDLKTSNDQLTTVTTELASVLKSKAETQPEKKGDTEVPDKKPETKPDKEEKKPETKSEQKPSSDVEDLKKQLEELRQDIIKRDERSKVEREAEKQREEVAKYREQLIVGLPTELAEIVPADTKENVDKFINNLKLGFEKIAPAPVQARSGSLLTAGARTPSTPAQGVNLQGQPLTADAINNMTPEQYMKFRNENPQLVSGAQRPGFETQKFGGMTLRRQ